MSDFPFPAKPKKKTDYAALNSPLKRIPGMDIASVRDLIDIGITSIDDLYGRAPEVLLEEVLRLRPQTPHNRIAYFRMAVYYAETDTPDPAMLQPHRWEN